MRARRIRGGVRQIVTSVNDKELADLRAYAKRKKLSLYALLKAAVFDYVKRNP